MEYESEIIDLTDSFTAQTEFDCAHARRSNNADITIIEIDETRYPSWKKIRSSIKGSTKLNTRLTPSQTATIELLEDSPIKVEKRSVSNGFGDCPICFEELGKNPLASTICGHIYCLKCLEQSLCLSRKCPNCRRPLKKTGYHPLYLS